MKKNSSYSSGVTFLTEIQFYLLAKDIDKKCPQNNVKILYFYDENRDETQGDILVYLKKSLTISAYFLFRFRIYSGTNDQNSSH